MCTTLRKHSGIDGHGGPNVYWLGVYWKVKASRHHSNYGVVFGIQDQGSPDNLWIAVEALLPESLGEQDYATAVALFVFFGSKEPACDRGSSKQRKEVSINHAGL